MANRHARGPAGDRPEIAALEFDDDAQMIPRGTAQPVGGQHLQPPLGVAAQYRAQPSELTVGEIIAVIYWIGTAAERPGWAQEHVLALQAELRRREGGAR